MLRKIESIDEAYENLANAIIVQACNDYIKCKKAMLKTNNYQKHEAMSDEILRIERFFRSSWYKELTNVDGEYLIKKLSEMVRE